MAPLHHTSAAEKGSKRLNVAEVPQTSQDAVNITREEITGKTKSKQKNSISAASIGKILSEETRRSLLAWNGSCLNLSLFISYFHVTVPHYRSIPNWHEGPYDNHNTHQFQSGFTWLHCKLVVRDTGLRCSLRLPHRTFPTYSPEPLLPLKYKRNTKRKYLIP